MAEFRHHAINRLSAEDALKQLETGDGGLTAAETYLRLSELGPNVLVDSDRYPLLRRLTCQFIHLAEEELTLLAEKRGARTHSKS